jgi:CheY-like chemotaxis protein
MRKIAPMKKQILVIDDEIEIRLAIETLFEETDYEVISLSSGQEALEKLKNGLKPDIVLLDLMMPDMSGYRMLDELYRLELHTSFSLIVMSGDVLMKHQMDQMGIKGFLSKPFDIDKLQQMVESL